MSRMAALFKAKGARRGAMKARLACLQIACTRHTFIYVVIIYMYLM